jgi:preprotein translocase subunit SecG
MFPFLIVLLVLDSMVLMTAVLLQSGKGGGLAAMGGGASTESFLGGRQAVTLLHTASWWAGGIFLALSLTLAGLSSRGGSPSSVLEGQLEAPAPVSAPPLPLDVEPQGGNPPQGQTPPAQGQTPPANR